MNKWINCTSFTFCIDGAQITLLLILYHHRAIPLPPSPGYSTSSLPALTLLFKKPDKVRDRRLLGVPASSEELRLGELSLPRSLNSSRSRRGEPFWNSRLTGLNFGALFGLAGMLSLALILEAAVLAGRSTKRRNSGVAAFSSSVANRLAFRKDLMASPSKTLVVNYLCEHGSTGSTHMQHDAYLTSFLQSLHPSRPFSPFPLSCLSFHEVHALHASGNECFNTEELSYIISVNEVLNASKEGFWICTAWIFAIVFCNILENSQHFLMVFFKLVNARSSLCVKGPKISFKMVSSFIISTQQSNLHG